jgi:DNA-directed RNA polymerase subunit RPC12/RpoP
MISSSDVPACPACGCREVHPVTRPPERSVIEKLADDIAAEPETLQTFYACRNCGRDNTEAWKAVQPAPEPKPVIGNPEPTIDAEAHRLGIAATDNGRST